MVVLLLPALGLTALRLLQPGAGWAVRAVAFTPLALPLYVAALVGLVVLTGAAARGRRGRRAVALPAAAALVVTVLTLLHLSWLAPAYTADAPPAASGSPHLRVLTANVLHDGATAGDILRLARDADADVVVLAELTRPQWDGLRAAGVRRGWPHAAGLATVGRHETVVLGRRPVEQVSTLPTVGDSLLVRVRLGERSVGLLAVHPRYPERPEHWRDDHEAIAAAVREQRPAVVAGDFNATYDHAVMQRYRDLGYRSADELLGTGWSPTWPDHGSREVMGIPVPRLVQIDHVLVSRGLTAVDVEHLELPGSDHRAVVAEVAPR